MNKPDASEPSMFDDVMGRLDEMEKFCDTGGHYFATQARTDWPDCIAALQEAAAKIDEWVADRDSWLSRYEKAAEGERSAEADVKRLNDAQEHALAEKAARIEELEMLKRDAEEDDTRTKCCGCEERRDTSSTFCSRCNRNYWVCDRDHHGWHVCRDRTKETDHVED